MWLPGARNSAFYWQIANVVFAESRIFESLEVLYQIDSSYLIEPSTPHLSTWKLRLCETVTKITLVDCVLI